MPKSRNIPQKNNFFALLARDRQETHRTATQLELLFDLVVVIAIATSSHGLIHEFSEGHFVMGIIKFLFTFFALWWPWNLFTWFASAFDNDDGIYRLNVMIMAVGVMLVAANIPMIFKGESLTYGFFGYIILRLSLAVLWLRVSGANPQLKTTANRYGSGQILVQVLWAIIVFTTQPWSALFLILVMVVIFLDLAIPWYAEQAANTPWHRHHIIERFGLLNIIVLGEVLLSSTHAIEAAIDNGFNLALMVLAICGAAIAFMMWWLYFCEKEHLESIEIKRTFIWAYGHFIVFASGAATGAGLNFMVDVLNATHHSEEHLSLATAAWTMTIPLALYIVGLWLVRDRYQLKKLHSSCLLFFAVLIGLSALLPYPPIPSVILMVICLSFRLGIAHNSEMKLKSKE